MYNWISNWYIALYSEPVTVFL